MTSGQTPFRVFGQRSIAPSFLLRASNPCKVSKDDVQNNESKKDCRVSLSDFLNRKLNRNSVPPKFQTVQEKSRPFSSLLSPREVIGSTDGRMEDKQRREEEKIGILDKVAFEQFKQGGADKVDSVVPCSATETENANVESRKRKNLFEAMEGKDTTRKPILVLGQGDHPKPKQKGLVASYNSRKKPKHPYNHYGSGWGWWNSDMEGVDSEEVGFSEVWEGVGSTTFGGNIDWH
ncbi:uncharacterized protein LOC110813998 [Carica papaya]|uniref:uncharacterized protein LOC110813998 n=1 Tax=Carica papaya TaxID=3649 RepID=UPI000B8CD425|nr:uncharacterized protein LOC110813998 [Carica papaya]